MDITGFGPKSQFQLGAESIRSGRSDMTVTVVDVFNPAHLGTSVRMTAPGYFSRVHVAVPKTFERRSGDCSVGCGDSAHKSQRVHSVGGTRATP